MTGRKANQAKGAAVVSPMRDAAMVVRGSSQPSAPWPHEAPSSLHSVAHVPAAAARAPAVPQKPSCGTSTAQATSPRFGHTPSSSPSQHSLLARRECPTARRVALRLRSASQAKRLGPASGVETYKWNVTSALRPSPL